MSGQETSKDSVKLMLVDDDPFILKLFAATLTKLGYTQITPCDSGKHALDWLDHHLDNWPDLIFLDLNMPDMDGMEVIRHLVEIKYSGDIVLVSGEGERMLQSVGTLIKTQKLAFRGILQKPIKPDALYELLKNWRPPSQANRTASTTEVKAYSAEALRTAITDGELVIYYQPQVDVISGKVVATEALVRWLHPEDGLVFPDQFISLAEQYGLINELTQAVIQQAFLQHKIWQNLGLQLRAAINISMDNLASLEFLDQLVAQTRLIGIAPSDIVLEVTESRLMKDPFIALEILTRLRLMRFSLSIDDFGTGHSSMTQLHDVPFDELKIDRSFVHGAANDEMIRAIYDASLRLAKRIGMKSVGEGVEDETDWDFLQSTGCDLAQGYFIAKPMPASEIPDWITDWQANFDNRASCKIIAVKSDKYNQ